MNRVGNVIALTIALTAGLWIYSYASPGDAQTYVSRSGSIDFALDGPSSSLLAQHQEDSIRVDGGDSTKLKDPGVAVLYALLPGLVVHGAGHFYAGKTKTGAVLLGAEVVGGSVYFIGAMGKGFSQLEGGQPWKYGDVLMVFGGVLFVGSWIYDLFGAPRAVQRENQEFLQGKRPDLGLRVRAEDVSVVVVYRFR